MITNCLFSGCDLLFMAVRIMRKEAANAKHDDEHQTGNHEQCIFRRELPCHH